MDATRLPSAADRAYAHVRDGVLSARYPDNDLLAEGVIADEVGVSRTPVREALLRLEAEGMIRLLPKRGALVLPVTAAEWRDVLDTRLLVELHSALRVLAAGNGPALARRLADPLRALDDAAENRDLAGYVATDRSFHATIVAAGGNQILNRLYGSLRDRQLRMGAANLIADGGPDAARMARTAVEHRAIADALGSQDAALTERLTREHIAGADRAIRGLPDPAVSR